MKKKKKSETKKKSIKKIIIISAICLIVIGTAGYFIFTKFIQKDFRKFPMGENGPEKNFREGEEFQPINETTKTEITSFFENSPSLSQVEEYCNQNPMFCMYYCQEINQNHESCEELINNKQMPPEGEYHNE